MPQESTGPDHCPPPTRPVTPRWASLSALKESQSVPLLKTNQPLPTHLPPPNLPGSVSLPTGPKKNVRNQNCDSKSCIWPLSEEIACLRRKAGHFGHFCPPPASFSSTTLRTFPGGLNPETSDPTGTPSHCGCGKAMWHRHVLGIAVKWECPTERPH